MLKEAKLIGAASKPQNLGISYKLYFMISDSRVVSVEIYRESFSQKISQSSYTFEGFENNFVGIKPESENFMTIINALSKKVNLDLSNDSDYIIDSVSGKDYLFGNLFKIIIKGSDGIER